MGDKNYQNKYSLLRDANQESILKLETCYESSADWNDRKRHLNNVEIPFDKQTVFVIIIVKCNVWLLTSAGIF